MAAGAFAIIVTVSHCITNTFEEGLTCPAACLCSYVNQRNGSESTAGDGDQQVPRPVISAQLSLILALQTAASNSNLGEPAFPDVVLLGASSC